jgi:hypothetical protein
VIGRNAALVKVPYRAWIIGIFYTGNELDSSGGPLTNGSHILGTLGYHPHARKLAMVLRTRLRVEQNIIDNLSSAKSI